MKTKKKARVRARKPKPFSYADVTWEIEIENLRNPIKVKTPQATTWYHEEYAKPLYLWLTKAIKYLESR
jgi:hypothetical protein